MARDYAASRAWRRRKTDDPVCAAYAKGVTEKYADTMTQLPSAGFPGDNVCRAAVLVGAGFGLNSGASDCFRRNDEASGLTPKVPSSTASG
jgi:hypothetical protein